MSGIVVGCIAPHGGNIVAEIAGSEAASTAELRKAMEELGETFQAAQPDTVVVLTPHGVRVADRIAISDTERAFGKLEGDSGCIDASFQVDRELARLIAQHAEAVGVPTALVNYGASSGPASTLPLDWGALIPLWYMGARFETQPRVVVITPTRSLPLEKLLDFGSAIAQAAKASGRRVALIASADQAHAHQAEGPYGYDPAAREYDAFMQKVVQEDDLKRLLTLDPAFVDAAKPDSLWQTLILEGARDVTPLKARFLAYQVPTYFGMLCASYTA